MSDVGQGLHVSQYERPVEDVVSESERETKSVTTPEDLARKMAAVRDTGAVSTVISFTGVVFQDKRSNDPGQLSLTSSRAGDGNDLLPLAQYDLDAFGWAFERERPYWTTQELMGHVLTGKRPREGEVFYARLSVDDNAVWRLDLLYTDVQYERLFMEKAEPKWRIYANSVRRLGRVTSEQFPDVELFERPKYNEFDERDVTSRLL